MTSKISKKNCPSLQKKSPLPKKLFQKIIFSQLQFRQKNYNFERNCPPPTKKIIFKIIFFSISISSTQIVIPWWTAGGVRALWVSEHHLWRTRYPKGSIWRHPDLLKSAPLIQTPDTTPVIDWNQVKFKPVLPKPELFPVQSAPQDPVLYDRGEKNHYGVIADPMFNISKIPFGQMWGYLNN